MKTKILFILMIVIFAAGLFADNLTLCYHKFEYSTTDMYSVMPEVFEWQVNYMKEKKLDIIHLQKMVDYYDKGLGSIDKTALITIDDGWKSEKAIIPLAIKYNAPVTLFLYKLVLNRSSHYFSYDDLDAFKATGVVDFGSHSYTHIPLIKKDSAVLTHEIVDGKTAVEDVLKMKLDAFAYPYGMFDSEAKKMASTNFKIAFGVNDGWNGEKTDKYNLNRFVIYKSIGFGEFMSYVNYAVGDKDKGYSVHFLGTGRDDEGHFDRIKFKVYKYDAKVPSKKALIIPSSGAGPAWSYKLVKKLNESGFDCYVMSGRNNYVPFYNPNAVMKVVKDWGLPEMIRDMKETVDYAVQDGKKPVVFAWGDGFDSFMALLGSDPKYADKVSGIIAVNPSLSGALNDVDNYKQQVETYDSMIAKGQYEEEGLNFFLKVKTLLDLIVLKPNAPSPFAKTMGFPGYTNKALIASFLDSAKHPELGFDMESFDGLLDEYKEACMQPMPLLSMVVPVAFMRDLNQLWYEDFYSKELGVEHVKEVNLPAAFFYSKVFGGNESAIKSAMSALKITDEYTWDEQSTVEILLNDDFLEKSIPVAASMSGEPVTATAGAK